MSISEGYMDYIREQLEELGPVVCRKMFGGAGVFLEGKVFGVIADDVLYFKADDSNREDYASSGMEQFRPFPDKDMMMPYWRVPEGVLEDPAELREWALKSLAIPSSKKGKKS